MSVFNIQKFRVPLILNREVTKTRSHKTIEQFINIEFFLIFFLHAHYSS